MKAHDDLSVANAPGKPSTESVKDSRQTSGGRSPTMEKHPQELRWEARRLLFEARSATDEAQRKSMVADALELTSRAKMQEKQRQLAHRRACRPAAS